VRIPSGTAAVCALCPRSSTKVGHWETGKAERLTWIYSGSMSQKTCLKLLAFVRPMASRLYTQEFGCDDFSSQPFYF